ncbi:MAG: 50S ribosomal protein L25 [Chloroflexi bacterium]|nr:50S ribosomal protein L25 [Chloroflexota bacterium]
MAAKISISVARRAEGVKARALRRQKIVPAIMYGHSFEPCTLQLDYLTAQRVVEQAGTSHLVNLSIQGENGEHMVLIREVQRDPVTDFITHLDFYRLVAGEMVTTEVPIALIGEAPAVEDRGGTLNQLLDAVEIECLPSDIPEALELDVSGLVDFDSSLTVADLRVPQGVKVLLPADTELVRVLAPRLEEEIEAPAEAELPEEVEKGEAGEEAEVGEA